MSGIDREVAEKVMRFQCDGALIHEEVIGDCHRCELYYPKPDGSESIPGYDEPDEFWSPSTRIDHAWEVVEKLDLWSMEWHRDTQADDRYDLTIWLSPEGVYGATADTIPEAICRAALQAVKDADL